MLFLDKFEKRRNFYKFGDADEMVHVFLEVYYESASCNGRNPLKRISDSKLISQPCSNG
jgi:hypothetical protein